MQKVDELIEMLADHIKEGISRRGLSDCYVEGTRALAELVSARAENRRELFFQKKGIGGGAPEPKKPIPVPCPPKSNNCEKSLERIIYRERRCVRT